MRIEYINPFVEATLYVLGSVLGKKIRRDNLHIDNSPFEIMDIAALIHISGDVKGRSYIDFDYESALNIASAMNQQQQTEITDLVKSSIGELANMITANAATLLAKYGFQFEISPPQVVTKADQYLEIGKTLIVPLILGNGHMEINVAVKEHA